MDFLRETLLRCQGNVWLSSLKNTKDESEHDQKSIQSRDEGKLQRWLERHDEPGRGTFLCVSTIQAGKRRRNLTTVQETPFVHLDVDLKDTDLSVAEVDQRLLAASKPPSYVVHSGNGVHGYWALDPPHVSGDAVKGVLLKLQRCFAGDRMVCHSAALMRLPGSHNSKNGAWKEVVVAHRTGRVYTLEELEEWDLQPMIVPRARGAEVKDPFQEYADREGYKAPMDVESRLAAMKFKGEGEEAIHLTQLSATAALLSRGVSEDDVVEQVLEATRVAAGSARWNWAKEEEKIRAMCTDWEAKTEFRAAKEKRDAEKPKKRVGEAPEGEVVSLAAARGKKLSKGGDKAKAHVVLGQGVLAAMRAEGGDVLVSQGQMWACRNGVWRALTPAEEKDWLDVMVERGCRSLSLTSKNTLASEVRSWIRRQPELHFPEVDWDGHKKIATQSGLVDPDTREVTDLTPGDRVTRVLECKFDPRARCPWWLQMVEDLFDEEHASFLQEVFGSFLVDDRIRAMRRALVIVGQSNTGKSNLIEAIGGFFSSDANSTAIEALEGAHGMMAFARAVPWIIHEAFERGKWHFSAKAKAILSGDSFQVNFKNGPMVQHTFKQPIVWATNDPPQFRESSMAMKNRLVIVELTRVFEEGEVVGTWAEARRQGYNSLADFVLATERSGMLNWAIEGWQRLKARGRFDPPALVLAAGEEMYLSSNAVAAFMRDCVVIDRTCLVRTEDFYGAFMSWWSDAHGSSRNDTPLSKDGVVKELRRLPNVSTGGRYQKKRVVAGVRLNDEGLDAWFRWADAQQTGRGPDDTRGQQDVNRPIPEGWSAVGDRQGDG